MSLNSLHLDGLEALAKHRSFSRAAAELNVTQSALSQRIQNLESEVGSTLVIRNPSGLQLTELGQKLLRYCELRRQVENEILQGPHSGWIRVAGFSTITRSILLPILAKFVSTKPKLQLDLQTRELRDLPYLLTSGAVDYALTLEPIRNPGVMNEQVGVEENVLISPKGKLHGEDIMIDHDEDDTTTADFWRLQKTRVPKYRRIFLDEIESILEGVALGLGRAVVPIHLALKNPKVQILEGHKALRLPIYLNYFEQPFFNKMQTEVLEALRSAPL